ADMPLYSICLGANAITQLPLDMELLRKSLAVLRLDRNAIPAIPTRLYECDCLVELNLSNNLVEACPAGISKLGNPFNATEVMVRPLLEMAAQAKHDLEHRNYKTAAALFTALLNQASAVSVMSKELEPIRAHATFYRGICRYQQKIELRTAVQEWKLEAQADFKQAIRYQVEPTTAAFTLGSLYAKTFQLPEAIEMLTHALKYFTNGITQGAVPILLQRAEAWEQLGQPPMANDDYKLVLTVDPSHDIAIARLAALETHQAKYHVGFDTDAHKRAFVMEPNGICHRRNDPTISLTRLNEIDSPTKFAEACDSLRDAKQRAMYIEVTKKVEAKKSRQGRVTQVKQLMREIQERQAMEREEEDQFEREAAIEFFRRQKALEWQREENERQWMQYEEASQRWVESELERIRLEELAALEEARRKAEAKAEYKKRLARRGGLRQGGRSGKR
ncbi:hypothetical protein DYB32_006286, partial [Aphanomyces invadans]